MGSNSYSHVVKSDHRAIMNKEPAVPTSVDHLPSEVLFEIMTMLPPESLLSCTRVCQSWPTLIRSPGFIAACDNRNPISNNTGYLMLEHITIGGKLERVFSSYDGSLEQRGEASSVPFDYFRGWGNKIVASTNGLVCRIDKYAVGAIIPLEPGLKQAKESPSFRHWHVMHPRAASLQARTPTARPVKYSYSKVDIFIVELCSEAEALALIVSSVKDFRFSRAMASDDLTASSSCIAACNLSSAMSISNSVLCTSALILSKPRICALALAFDSSIRKLKSPIDFFASKRSDSARVLADSAALRFSLNRPMSLLAW
ncbi:hypothetical protein RJ639_015725 [Escallonia herrerae]|uniref:F-box domain-containing protein n=1 Tax=Escallonia herrerae TaxID=1293975 RepID=A0AA89ALI9_9ASTE|nr:hypothetical protein RJ639_015725 [Escallonia herrerae]